MQVRFLIKEHHAVRYHDWTGESFMFLQYFCGYCKNFSSSHITDNFFTELTLFYMATKTHSFRVSAQNVNVIVLSVGM